MNRSTLYAAAMIAISAAAFLPATSMAQIGVNLVIGNAPPPPRFENVPPPRHGYVWAPGFWRWDGHHHVWLDGHWEHERVGYEYRRPEWVSEGDGWRFNDGGWVVVQQGGYRDDGYLPPPPPPRFESMPPPRHGYVWAPGHWDWDGHHHQWSNGVWIAERPGYIYRPAAWRQRDGHWFIEQGGWAPHGGPHDGWEHGGPHGDRDHDGVPDRYDNHPDNPRRD